MPTLILEITPEIQQALAAAAAGERAAQNGTAAFPKEPATPEQIALTALLAGLRNRPAPQTLADLKPERVLPPGRTLKDVLDALPAPEWGKDETDEKLLAALKSMDEE